MKECHHDVKHSSYVVDVVYMLWYQIGDDWWTDDDYNICRIDMMYVCENFWNAWKLKRWDEWLKLVSLCSLWCVQHEYMVECYFQDIFNKCDMLP